MKHPRLLTVSLLAAACALAMAFAAGCTPSTPGTPNTPADPNKLTAETAESLGYQVFEGTVYVVSPEELLAMQSIAMDPAGVSNGGTYAVLVFDEACDVTGMSADGSGERTKSAEILGLAEYTEYTSFVVEYGDMELWKSLDCRRATIAVKAEDITFPTDVRLPVGQPAASDAVVLS